MLIIRGTIPERVFERINLQSTVYGRLDGTVTDGLKPASNPAWLPFQPLLSAFSTVFLFGNNDRGCFCRSGPHADASSEYLAVAVNFSLEHNFLTFHRQASGADGTPVS